MEQTHDVVAKSLVDPCKQRTKPTDGARPSTNVACSHQRSAGDARRRTDRGGSDLSQLQPQQRRSAERQGSNATERQQTAVAAATETASAARLATPTAIGARHRLVRTFLVCAHGRQCDAELRDSARQLTLDSARPSLGNDHRCP